MAQDRQGYLLRILTDEWVQQVKTLKKYYSGVLRRWEIGTPILFLKKTSEGDSIIGYGITSKVEMLWEMTPEEEDYCKENGWRCALSFQPLVWFPNPIPLRNTFLAQDKRKGSFLHGALLSEAQVDELLDLAEEYSGQG